MSVNRCARCNHKMTKSRDTYGWRCAIRLGIDQGAPRTLRQMLDESGEQYTLLRNEYEDGGHGGQRHDSGNLSGDYLDIDLLAENAVEYCISINHEKNITGRTFNEQLHAMWDLSTAEIIARCIIGEGGDKHISEQNRLNACHTIINRMLTDDLFGVGEMENGRLNRKKIYSNKDKTLRGLMFGIGEYNAILKEGRSNPSKGNAYMLENYLKDEAAMPIWRTTRIMAACLVALFNDTDTKADVFDTMGKDSSDWRAVADIYHERFDALYHYLSSSTLTNQLGDYHDSFRGSGGQFIFLTESRD